MEIGCVLSATPSSLPGMQPFRRRRTLRRTSSGSSRTNWLRDSPRGEPAGVLENSAVSEQLGSVGGPGLNHGLPILTVPRVGQQAFKSLIFTSYHCRCAITGNRVEPALQAAHIRPVAHDGQHRVDNDLLLRSDVHILFDRGYLGIDEKHRLHVSPRLRSDFGNGEEFYSKRGSVIALPDRKIDRPHRDAVAWHMEGQFMSA